MCNGLILFISSQVLPTLLSGVVHRAVFNEILSGESIMYRYNEDWVYYIIIPSRENFQNSRKTGHRYSKKKH